MSKLLEEEQEREIRINKKALQRLTWARKEGESYSDVIIRLSSTKLEGLQRRGEKVIVTSDGRKIALTVEQEKCMGAESCVSLAPEVFALDESHLGFARRSAGEPLAMRDVMDKTIDRETIIQAVRSCPYEAITVIDAETGEDIYP